MVAKVLLGREQITLRGTLMEFFKGEDESTVCMAGGENEKVLRNLFSEVRKEGQTYECGGVIKNSICIVEEDGSEIIKLPGDVRVWIGVEN
jgi:hypothetical protein